MKKLKICIISEYAYSQIQGHGKEAGGAELQMTILAKELVKRSYDVSFMVFANMNRNYDKINGIKVFMPYDANGRGHKHFYPNNFFRLVNTFRKIDADVYIQRAGTPLTGILAFLAKINKKIFLFSSSSDGNLSTDLEINGFSDVIKIFYILGIKYSKKVICQTDYQNDLINKKFDNKGVVIKNMFPYKSKNKLNTKSNIILWVGRISPEKNPELFLKLAKNLHQFNFVMIGGTAKGSLDYFNAIKKRSEEISNLDFLGFIPHYEINNFYCKTSFLVSTSNNEGFPNIFLEAWGNGIPVLSLNFDPDGIISKYYLGFNAKNFNELKKKTVEMQENFVLRSFMGKNGIEYVNKEHNVNRIISNYEYLFDSFRC